MKENWTYKKLGEVASFINGYPFKPSDWKEKGRPIIRIQNLTNPNAVFNLFDGEIDAKYIIHKGDVLISWSATLGVFEWSYDYDGLLNQHIFKVVFDKDDIDKSFFKYVVASRINEMKEKVHGITMQHITKGEFDKTVIPVPPIETQSRIVSELDLLQSIIDKQKAQLKELDNLAQAVFYDMFGDPVENEKGWEVKRVEDLCEVSSAKRVLVEDVVESGIPFLRGTELTALSKVVSSKDVKFTMFITPEHYERVKSITGVPKKGDILIPSINSEGITWVVDTDEPFYFKDGRVIWVHVNTDAFVSQYLSFVISKILKANYTVLTSGATFLELKLFIIRDLVVPIPPLSLQQSFAAKIESIEKQKATITKSIEESQKLFDYTMDKYFG